MIVNRGRRTACRGGDWPVEIHAVGFRARTAVDTSPQTQERTREAVERAKVGDREALRFLYARYADSIYGYVRGMVRDHHEAEDITQHVFAKLITAIVKYDDRGNPFFAWLLRLARNVTIDHMRAQRVAPQAESGDQRAGNGVGFEEAGNLERSMVVWGAIATLPEDQREVVVLRHLVGLTPGEIANRMGRTEGSIHGLHHRGRLTLQNQLAESEMKPTVRVAA